MMPKSQMLSLSTCAGGATDTNFSGSSPFSATGVAV